MKAKKAKKAQSTAAPLLLYGATQLVTMRGGNVARRSAAMRDVGLIEDGAVLISGGKIVAVGTTDELHKDAWLKQNKRRVEEIDCSGLVLIPGFVDSHTHTVFTAPRLIDFEKRIAGASYEEIAEAGGGIRSSIAGVRGAPESGLAALALDAFDRMMEHGTTTIEAKSGYGLSVDAELKSLRAIKLAASEFAGTIVPTLLGAHVPPPEFRERPDEYVKIICEEMIPKAARGKLARFVDVFCERGAFTLKQTERIFEAATEHKMRIRAHIGQLSETKLASLLRFQPVSLDHLDFVGDADVRQLAKSEVVATLVPGANYFLATEAYAPARKLIDAGVAVALATDFNPGSSPMLSMPFALSLACTQMKMSPAEALAASTINGAASLALADRKGSIEVGKDADIALFELDDYREIAYWFGDNRCVGVVVNGVPLDDDVA
jgi:imidazolonepropionase